MSLDLDTKKTYALLVRSSYGDLLMTAPLINYIRKINQSNRIALFVEEKNAQLVPFMQNVDEFHVLPSKGNKYFQFIFYGLKYRRKKFDISIAAKTGVGSANGFFPFFLGAKNRISYVKSKKTWTDRLVNQAIVYNENIYHNQHYSLSVLQLLNPLATKVDKCLYPKINSPVGSSLKNNNIRVFTSVSNNRSSCTLDLDTLSIIINSLAKRYQFDVVISAMANDIEQAKKLQNKLLSKSMVQLSPNIADLLTLLKSVDLCFIGEGGVMHMAAALDIEQVVLFGHTSPTTWAPLSDKAIVLSDKESVNLIPKNLILSALDKKLQMIVCSQKNENLK